MTKKSRPKDMSPAALPSGSPAPLESKLQQAHDSRRAALNLMEDAVQSRQATERLNAELLESEERLARELTATRQLQAASALMIEGGDTHAIYQKIVDAAVVIMRSDFASMQMLYPERASGQGELLLVAHQGFTPESAEAFTWVRADSGCTCGESLRTGTRTITPDVETASFIVGRPAFEAYRQSGIRAVQTTPLFSRGGKLLGMISTHWRAPHTPAESDLRQFDILARLTSDLMEHKQTEDALRESEERFRSLVSVITDVPWVTDATGAFTTPQPAWEAYTGQTWEEHRGFGWTDALHPDDRESVKEIWHRACESRTLYESEGRLWHAPTQGWRYFMAKATPLLNADGSVREWVGTCIDCDDQKRVE
ncbi:MAG TPA: PAS domain-containing protein, partial [Burkholderiales bacterium]|nr:PAS domain-containing protein [Burkholderiales bacterium]